MTIENFKVEYSEHDPDELVDILNISTEEILNRFEDKIEVYLDNTMEDNTNEET